MIAEIRDTLSYDSDLEEPEPPQTSAWAQPPSLSAPHSYHLSRILPGPAPARRVLTLLIEAQRKGKRENMLTEVKVPLRDIGEAIWAQAQDVTEELQKGPSRIVGKYRVTSYLSMTGC